MKSLKLNAVIWAVRICGNVPLLWMLFFLHFDREGSGGTSDMLFNATLFAAWGAFHSLTARDIAKRAVAGIVGESAVKALYVIVSGITFSLVLYFWRPLSGTVWHLDGPYYWVVTTLYIVGILAFFYTTRFVDMAEFFGIRVYLRSSRNKPAKPQSLSVKGPYAYCRHPMYLVFIALLWIGPVMTYGRLEFAAVGTLYMLVGTYFEEWNLRVELGEVYDRYRENVPMWIPRLTPWRQV